MSLINTCNLLLTNLHRCLDEAVKAVYGFAPLPVAGSLADRAASLKAAFDENPSAFVATPTHLAALNSLLAEYRQQAFPANTTTITVEATRLIAWNDVTNKPVRFPPTAHAHDYASITGKPATFPPENHAHDYASITDKPTTFPPENHAHDLLQIGSVWLRDNAGTLETSTDGVTWMGIGGVDLTQYAKTADLAAYALKTDLTPYALNADLQAHINNATVHGGGTPAAYALAWTDGSAIFSRQVPGAWLNENVQIWMRVYLPSSVFFWFGDVAMTYNSGGIYLTSYNSNGDGTDYPDDRTTIAEGWHDVALQWTQAANACILYIDGIGGTPITAYKRTLDAAINYDIRFQAAGLKVAALVMSDQLTWSATAAAKDTIGAPLFSLPLSEGSGATATDSTGTAWTIPAGVVWEAI